MDKWNNDDWNGLDHVIEDMWDDPWNRQENDDDEGYQAQVRAELVVKLKEFFTFSTREDLDHLIQEYV